MWRRLALALLLSCTPVSIGMAGDVLDEYQLKSALIYKLTRFIDWPKWSDSPPESFGLCVLGRDDFGAAIDALSGKNIKKTPVDIHRYNQSSAIGKQCQLVFISDSKRAFFREIIDSFGNSPILTISDADRFAELGGMIELYQAGGRMGFRINLEKARAAGFRMAAPLLQMSTIVTSTDEAATR